MIGTQFGYNKLILSSMSSYARNRKWIMSEMLFISYHKTGIQKKKVHNVF